MGTTEPAPQISFDIPYGCTPGETTDETFARLRARQDGSRRRLGKPIADVGPTEADAELLLSRGADGQGKWDIGQGRCLLAIAAVASEGFRASDPEFHARRVEAILASAALPSC